MGLRWAKKDRNGVAREEKEPPKEYDKRRRTKKITGLFPVGRKRCSGKRSIPVRSRAAKAEFHRISKPPSQRLFPEKARRHSSNKNLNFFYWKILAFEFLILLNTFITGTKMVVNHNLRHRRIKRRIMCFLC